MIFVILLLASILFIESFLLLGLGRETRGLVHEARTALRALGDGWLSDHEKETLARAAARRIFGATARCVLKLSLIVAALAALLAMAALASPAVGEGVTAALSSPGMIVALTLAAGGYGWLRSAIL